LKIIVGVRQKSSNWSRTHFKTLLAMLTPVLLGIGPCGPIPGGPLEGKVNQTAIKDFRFVDNVNNCLLEVEPSDPHSVTVNCWSVGKQLYIGCKDCDGKTWSTILNQTPFARIKIGEALYRVKAYRLTDVGAIARAWNIRWSKYEANPDPEPVPKGYWLYHLGSKPTA
jgi:hypothetical protein